MNKSPRGAARTNDTADAAALTPDTPAATDVVEAVEPVAGAHPNPHEGGCYVRLPSGELQREDD